MTDGNTGARLNKRKSLRGEQARTITNAGDQSSGQTFGETMEKYGIELILDMHGCDPTTFTRDSISAYFERLCVLIDMKREALHFWDDVGVPEEDK